MSFNNLPMRWQIAIEKGIVNGLYQFFATIVGLISYGQITNTSICLYDVILPALIIGSITSGLAFSKALKEEIEKDLAIMSDKRYKYTPKTTSIWTHLFL